jgi:hypothetical protein
MTNTGKYFLKCFPTLFLFIAVNSFSQKNKYDSSFFLAEKKGWLGKLGKIVSVNPNSPNADSLPVLLNNIDPYILYKGSIIRKIELVKIGFGESINDTSYKRKNTLTNIAEGLHKNSSSKAITNNLFFKKGDSVLPYLLGDNERFLRELPYLQDAKIVIKEIEDEYDSVDVAVLYKDLFSISGTVEASGNALFLQGQDDNLSGNGDRLQVSTLVDNKRLPKTGLGAEYLKRNIRGSFINFTLGYQSINPTFNSGRREETMFYSKLELPLVTPYYLWTGAIEIYSRFTKNNYDSDSLYKSDFKYGNTSFDGWAGYNVTAKKQLHELAFRKPKQFLAIRLTKINFYDVPNIYANQYNYQYADVTSYLGAYTIFKQTYYHTSYIYGFGRNEDVPAGFNVSAIAGWTNKQNYQRPYVGLDLQKNYFSKNQSYFNYNLKMGGYFYEGGFQDVGVLMNIESFSKLTKLNSRWYHRNFYSTSFTKQYNTFLNEPIRLSSNYGIPFFSELINYNANTRLTFNYECVLYSKWKFVGFGFAPFLGGSACYMKSKDVDLFSGDIFTTIAGGFRTRNEALIFGTLEFKLNYYPRTTPGMNPFNLLISADLKFKYNSQFIKRPDFITLN